MGGTVLPGKSILSPAASRGCTNPFPKLAPVWRWWPFPGAGVIAQVSLPPPRRVHKPAKDKSKDQSTSEFPISRALIAVLVTH